MSKGYHPDYFTTITITRAALEAVKAKAALPLTGQVKPLADGTFEVPISHGLKHILDDYMLKGESLSDCIVRVCRSVGRVKV